MRKETRIEYNIHCLEKNGLWESVESPWSFTVETPWCFTLNQTRVFTTKLKKANIKFRVFKYIIKIKSTELTKEFYEMKDYNRKVYPDIPKILMEP